MYIIGLTGGIACGKSNITRNLLNLGYPVIDADAISRSLTKKNGEAINAIREAFGDAFFDQDANLDRKKLAAAVFSNPKHLAVLNAILHPLIFLKMDEALMALPPSTPLVFLDVPLLYETHAEEMCDEVWCVITTEEEQLRRLMKRGPMTKAEAMQRIESQMPAKEKAQRADRVIETSGTYDETQRQLIALLKDLVRRIIP